MDERRRFTRYEVYCPIQYRSESDRPRDQTMTLNISEGGALIVSSNSLGLSTNIIIRVVLKSEEFFIRARTVHIEHGRENGTYMIGVEFLERPYSFTRKFYEELESIMLYQRQYSKEIGREISLADASVKWYRNSETWM